MLKFRMDNIWVLLKPANVIHLLELERQLKLTITFKKENNIHVLNYRLS